MTKKEIIHQILNEENIELYNFWVMKFFTEYPEYPQKLVDNWSKKLNHSSYKNFKCTTFRIDHNNIVTLFNNNDCFRVYVKGDLERAFYLNHFLRQEGYD